VQTTLKRKVQIVGTGLHSGRPARLVLHPASAEFGIWFRRADVNDRDNLIQAAWDNVSDTKLCTLISNDDGVSVGTIEHLMAALAGCGVHNVLIEIDGPEVPILDGSSRRYVREIMAAGLTELEAPIRLLRVLKEVSVDTNGAKASLAPHDEFEIDFEIEFPDAAIGHQARSLNLANGAFARELSDCRTFCRRSEIEFMHENGLALGGSLDNAIVVDGDEVLNPEGFRRSDECVRHKMLDALGDLYTAGMPILGRYRGERAGHGVTNQLLRKLFATPGAFEIVTCTPETQRRLPGFGIRPADLARAG
jgi:UDP-3-O-[3-hydroxymyristoyl] N-acetylglucosamine deacetylase